MLNYTENAHVSTNVPPLPVLCIQNQEGVTEPLPEMIQKQGQPKPPIQSTDPQPEVLSALETLTFRKAVIETECPTELRKGIVCGQACSVDLIHEAVTSKDLAHLFAETMNSSDEPEAFNVGFIIGMIDALLRARKTYPRGW